MSVIDPSTETSPSALLEIVAAMPDRERRRVAGLILLTLAGSAAEIVSIGSVVPLLALLTGTGGAARLPAALSSLPLTATAIALIFIGAAVAAGLFRLLLSWQSQQLASRTGHWLACEVHRRTLQQPYAYHLQAHSSGAMAALSKTQDFVWGVLLPVVQAASAAVMSLLIFALLMWLNAAAALGAALLFTSIYAALALLMRGRLTRYSQVVSEAYDQRIRILGDSLGGIRDIILDGSHAVHDAAFRRADARFAWAGTWVGFLGEAPRFLIETAALIALVALALLLATRDGLLPLLPTLGALALGAQRLLPLLQQVYQSWSAVAGHRAVIGDIAGYLQLADQPEGMTAQAPLPFASELRMTDIGFSYPGRGAAAVEGINLVLPKGSRTALCGRTGSGKSTLADLIMGLLAPNKGTISVDGVTLTEANRAAWRRNIAHVPQQIFLSDASLAENIAFGSAPDEIQPDRISEAVRIAQLESFMSELPDGLATRVGERGAQLSGGQRQRLALARAVYRGTPLLVLDEATNALDPETEADVLRALDLLQAEGVTILIIAHRTSSFRTCDQVLRLEAGRLVSAG